LIFASRCNWLLRLPHRMDPVTISNITNITAQLTAATGATTAKFIIKNSKIGNLDVHVAIASIVVGALLACAGLVNTIELRFRQKKDDSDMVFRDFIEDDVLIGIHESTELPPGPSDFDGCYDKCRDEWSLASTFAAYFGLDAILIGSGMFTLTLAKALLLAFLILSITTKAVVIFYTLRTFERKRKNTFGVNTDPQDNKVKPWQIPRVKNLWEKDIVVFAPLKAAPTLSGLLVKRLGNSNPLSGQPNLIDNVNALYESDITSSQPPAPIPANTRGVVTCVQNEGVRPYALVRMEAAPNDLLKIYKVNFHHLQLVGGVNQTSWNPKSIYANPAFGLFFTTFIFIIQSMLFFHVFLALQDKASCVPAPPLKLWCKSQSDVEIQKTRFFFAAWIVQCVSTLGGGAVSSKAAQKNVASLFRSREGALSYATKYRVSQWSMVADGVPAETIFRDVYQCELWLRGFFLFAANIFKTFILLATHIYLVQSENEMEFVKDSFALIFVAQLDAIGTYVGAQEDIVFRSDPKPPQRQRGGSPDEGYTSISQ